MAGTVNVFKINLFIVFCLFRVCALGQPGEQTETLFVSPFGVEQGLRQSMVSRVIQDGRGLIWMTTGDGLHCFDGREFRAFRVPVNDVYNHSDNVMRDLVETSPGILSVSSSSSLLHFNTTTGRFNIAFRENGSYPVLFSRPINRMPAAWIHKTNLNLVGNDRIFPMQLIFKEKNALPADFNPKTMVRFKSTELLITGDDGILLLDISPGTRSGFAADWLPVNKFQSVAGDRKGRVFIMAGGRIFQYLGQRKMKEVADTRITSKSGLFIDSRDNFWITTQANGKQYKLTNGKLRELVFCFHVGNHIDSIAPEITSVFEDDHHNIWFGTDNDGVLLYAPGQVQLMRADIGFTRCLAWFNHEIWAGTYREGLWKMSPDLLKVQRINDGQDPLEMYYLDMAADQKGRLWVASRSGLEVLDHQGKTIYRHKVICQSAKLDLSSGDTVTLFCDNRLYRILASAKPVFISSAGFIPVNAFLKNNGGWWFGNRFGLYRVSKSAGRNSLSLLRPPDQITTNAVNSLLLHGGSIWAATVNGIEIYDTSGKKRPLSASFRELQNEVIYAFLPDRNGQVWFTGNHGIGCIQAEKDHISYLQSKNNLQSLEFNYNAACTSPSGNIYFGGIHGVNGFDPGWFMPGNKNSVVRLISLFVSDTAGFRGIPPDYAEITLHHTSPHISGKVFTSDYGTTDGQLFSFFLEGYQREWSKPSPDAGFSYRNLPPGKYRLMVKCADSWQNRSEPFTLLSVTLNPPFWKTTWFMILAIFLLLTTTSLLVRKAISIRLKRQILALEQQNALEKERLRISKDMHDDLGASLTRISILSELAKKQYNDPARSQQLIEQISEISGGVVDDMSEIIWAMNPRNDTLDSFTSYIRQYASAYLESTGINGRFRFPEHIPAYSMSSELRRNLFLTVKEALHNIVKHAGTCDVNMHLAVEGETLRIRIMDNGKGFIVDEKHGRGNGLTNMRKRIEETGGLFELTSVVGTGTTLEFSVDLRVKEKSH